MSWTPEMDDMLVSLRQAGDSWLAIGGSLGVSSDAARGRYRRLAKHGYVTRMGDTKPEPAIFEGWDLPERPNWREWLSLFEEVNKMHQRANPILETLTIDFTHTHKDKPLVLASASDLHMGSGFANHRELAKTLQYIFDTPGLYVGIAGDSIEGFIPGTHGALPSEQMAGSVNAQLFAMTSLVDELTASGKLLYWTWGDHDAKWFEDRVGSNTVKLLIDRKVPYFSGRGLIQLKVGGQKYFLHVNHAERYKSMLNATHPQRRMYDLVFPADVSIAGHLHKPAYHVEHMYDVARELGLEFGGKTIFIQNGTFKTGPDTYTVRSWTRGIIGVPTLVFSNKEHDMDVFDSPLKAIQYIKGI